MINRCNDCSQSVASCPALQNNVSIIIPNTVMKLTGPKAREILCETIQRRIWETRNEVPKLD